MTILTSNSSFTGVIGSGLIGIDPWDRRSWSGISPYFFRACRKRGILNRVFGADVPKRLARLLMAANFRPDKERWRQRYYLDPRYRKALTNSVWRQIDESDLLGGFLQIGAMFDLPSRVNGRTWCTSYHDGNLALRLRNPFGAKVLSKLRTRQAMEFESKLYNRLDRIFTMSAYLRKSFIEDFDLPPHKVVSIGAGVNLDTIPDPTEPKDYEPQNILFIGIDFERKGGNLLLKAFSQVREVHPKARLDIVGPSNLSIPPQFQPGVTCHGFLSKANPEHALRLERLLHRATLFTLPSLYEPFGIAPAEAMLHATPCVVTGDWALAETVPENTCGWHIQPNSMEDLTQTLRVALECPDERRRRGVAARNHARNNFLWEHVTLRLNAELKSLRIP